jgi:hypothetical protein
MAMKKNLVIAGIIFLVFVAGLFLYPDEPLLDPNFIKIQKNTLPDPENGYFKLQEAVQALKLSDEQVKLREERLKNRQLNLYSVAERDELLQSNHQALLKMQDYIHYAKVAFPNEIQALTLPNVQYEQYLKSRPQTKEMNKLFWLKCLEVNRYRQAGQFFEASKAQKASVKYVAQNLSDANVINMALSIVQLNAVIVDLKYQLKENGKLSSEEKQLLGLLKQTQQLLKKAFLEAMRQELLLPYWSGYQICLTFPRYLCQPNANANYLTKNQDALQANLLHTEKKYPNWDPKSIWSFPQVLGPNLFGKYLFLNSPKTDNLLKTIETLESDIDRLSKI